MVFIPELIMWAVWVVALLGSDYNSREVAPEWSQRLLGAPSGPRVRQVAGHHQDHLAAAGPETVWSTVTVDHYQAHETITVFTASQETGTTDIAIVPHVAPMWQQSLMQKVRNIDLRKGLFLTAALLLLVFSYFALARMARFFDLNSQMGTRAVELEFERANRKKAERKLEEERLRSENNEKEFIASLKARDERISGLDRRVLAVQQTAKEIERRGSGDLEAAQAKAATSAQKAHETIKALEQQRLGMQKSFEETRKEVESRDGRIADLFETIKDLEGKGASATDAQTTIDRLKGELAEAERRRRAHERESETLREEITEIQVEAAKNISEQSSKAYILEAENTKLKTELDDERKKSKVDDDLDEIADSDDGTPSKPSEDTKAVKNELEEARKQAEISEAKATEAQDTISKLRAELEAKESKKEDALSKAQLEVAETTIAELKAEIKEMKGESWDARQKRDTVANEHKRDIAFIKSQHEQREKEKEAEHQQHEKEKESKHQQRLKEIALEHNAEDDKHKQIISDRNLQMRTRDEKIQSLQADLKAVNMKLDLKDVPVHNTTSTSLKTDELRQKLAALNKYYPPEERKDSSAVFRGNDPLIPMEREPGAPLPANRKVNTGAKNTGTKSQLWRSGLSMLSTDPETGETKISSTDPPPKPARRRPPPSDPFR